MHGLPDWLHEHIRWLMQSSISFSSTDSYFGKKFK